MPSPFRCRSTLSSSLALVAGLVGACSVPASTLPGPESPASPGAPSAPLPSVATELRAADPSPELPHHRATQQAKDPSSGGSAPVFVCPMHDDVRSELAGECPRCGMDLVPIELDAGEPKRDGHDHAH